MSLQPSGTLQPTLIQINDTITNFHKFFLDELKGHFVQILMMAPTMGVLKPGKVVLDATKVKSNASKHEALSWEQACKLEKEILAKVEKLLNQSEAGDREEVAAGMSMTEKLSIR